MRLSFLDDDLIIVDQGECDLDETLCVFDGRYLAGLSNYDTGEEALSQTYMCISRDERDFLGMVCNGEESVSVNTDRLVYPSAWSRLFGRLCRRREGSFELSKSEAQSVLRQYFELGREDFEKALVGKNLL